MGCLGVILQRSMNNGGLVMGRGRRVGVLVVCDARGWRRHSEMGVHGSAELCENVWIVRESGRAV